MNDDDVTIERLTKARYRQGDESITFGVGELVTPNEDWYALEEKHRSITGHIPATTYRIMALRRTTYTWANHSSVTAILNNDEEISIQYLKHAAVKRGRARVHPTVTPADSTTVQKEGGTALTESPPVAPNLESTLAVL